MKLFATFAFAVVAIASLAADAATFQYKISNSPANAFTRDGGLSGHKIFAGIGGTFAITYETNAPVVLSGFKLFLINVYENFPMSGLDITDLEGKPIQEFMSHDLEGSDSYGFTTGWGVQFATPVQPTADLVTTAPHSLMLVDWTDSVTVKLFSRLTPIGTVDGPTATFLSLTATQIPEPTTTALSGIALFALAALRRRK